MFSWWFVEFNKFIKQCTWGELCRSNFSSTHKASSNEPIPSRSRFFLLSTFQYCIFHFPFVLCSRWSKTCSTLLHTKCSEGCPSDIRYNLKWNLEASKKILKKKNGSTASGGEQTRRLPFGFRKLLCSDENVSSSSQWQKDQSESKKQKRQIYRGLSESKLSSWLLHMQRVNICTLSKETSPLAVLVNHTDVE